MGNIALLYAIRNGTIDLDCKDIWRHMQQQQLYSQLSFLTILIRGYFMGSLNSRKIMSFKNEYGRFFAETAGFFRSILYTAYEFVSYGILSMGMFQMGRFEIGTSPYILP